MEPNSPEKQGSPPGVGLAWQEKGKEMKSELWGPEEGCLGPSQEGMPESRSKWTDNGCKKIHFSTKEKSH